LVVIFVVVTIGPTLLVLVALVLPPLVDFETVEEEKEEEEDEEEEAVVIETKGLLLEVVFPLDEVELVELELAELVETTFTIGLFVVVVPAAAVVIVI